MDVKRRAAGHRTVPLAGQVRCVATWFGNKADGAARRGRKGAVRLGAPPGWFGYRHVEPEAVDAHAARMAKAGHDCAKVRVVLPKRVERNPLPRNFDSRDALPDTRGWWGYSMRDVPERESGQAVIVTVPQARIVSYLDDRNEFYPAILSCDARALDTREIRFRPGHAEVLRGFENDRVPPVRLHRATWVMERVYDNHSHWLTAHLPKLLMLRDRGLLEDVLLPQRLKPSMEASLRLIGIDPDGLPRYDPSRPLLVDELTIPLTDRFDPALLRPARTAMPRVTERPPSRKLYVSRARARFRRLENEDEIWPALEARGFEKVFLEDISFPEQVALMQEARAVVAPHGAGLTNMMFCPEGTLIAEIASLGFPNPNFYAVAAAMGHDYVLVPARAQGDGPPLEQDLSVAPAALLAALDEAMAAPERTGV